MAISKYRPDIDGLRAVAVGGVVLYHAFPDWLTGGFVGVDVFFVISGFLITSIIASDALAGRFSIADFYERRFRRILPALVMVLLASLVAALLILPPDELDQFGQSLLAVAGFASNILFWHEGGYFDGPAGDKPLLHTWSLAVEEQFYIVWPLIAAALVRMGRQKLLRGFVWAAVLVSLVAAEIVVRTWPDQAFYLLPYRAWELGFGALLAVGAIPALRTALQRETAGWTGLALIVAPMLFYTADTRFPGLSAVPPCLGALLLIHAGRDATTGAGRLLSLPPILFVGLVSYSFYLWHWPALVFPHIALNRALTMPEAALAVAAALALAALSLRFVERPFRGRGTARTSRRTALAISTGALVLFAGAGGAVAAAHGFLRHASPRMQAAQAALHSVNPLRAACHAEGQSSVLGPIERCVAGGARTDGYQVLLWGDSHADHLMPGLVAIGTERGFRVRQATVSGCSPLVLVGVVEKRPRPGCIGFHQAALVEGARQPKLQAVLVAAYWQLWLSRLGKDAAPAAAFPEQQAAGVAAFHDALTRIVTTARARVGPSVPIVLVGTTPSFGQPIGSCVSRQIRRDAGWDRCTRLSHLERWSAAADRVIVDVARETGSQAAMPRPLFCQGTMCRVSNGRDILYHDKDHLTAAGSRLAAVAMEPMLDGIAPPPRP